jgi:hypothetical protein
MGTTTPIEKALYDLKDYFQNNIETYLSAIETEKGDGILLPIFAVYELGYNNPFGQRSYPVICFVPSEIDIEPPGREEDIDIIVDVVFALTGNTPEELTKKQMRYTDAIRSLIASDNTLGGKVSLADTENANFFPADPDSQQINLTIMTIKIITEESIP